MGRGNLIKYYFTLNPSLYPSRVAYIDLTRNDVDAIYIDSVETTANLNNVYIRIEENDWVPAFAIIGGVESKDPRKTFKYLYIRWDSSQDNYKVVFLFSDQGIRLIIPITNYVIISADNVGLAKDSTVNTLDSDMKNVFSLFRPTVKASLISTSISANTNILSNSVTPSYNPSVLRIQASFSASGVLSVVRTKGSTTVTEVLNGGNALSASAVYIFDVVVEGNESINLQYSVAATLLRLLIVEVPYVIS